MFKHIDRKDVRSFLISFSFCLEHVRFAEYVRVLATLQGCSYLSIQRLPPVLFVVKLVAFLPPLYWFQKCSYVQAYRS